MIEFEIPELPPSPNRTRKGVWQDRARLAASWRTRGWAAAHNAALAAEGLPWERVQISAVFYLPNVVRRDPGNLVGSEGMKALLDGIVDAGIIADDCLPIVELYGPFDFEYRRGKPGVLIRVARRE